MVIAYIVMAYLVMDSCRPCDGEGVTVVDGHAHGRIAEDDALDRKKRSYTLRDWARALAMVHEYSFSVFHVDQNRELQEGVWTTRIQGHREAVALILMVYIVMAHIVVARMGMAQTLRSIRLWPV